MDLWGELVSIFGIKKKEVPIEEQQRITAKNWLPIKNIVNGIVILKNGTYVKMVEVTPVNFNLRSKTDKRFIILNFRAFLKACRFPMQISVQCRKADVDPHIRKMQAFYKAEKNENVKEMLRGYIRLVKSLSAGNVGAISRRFFLIFPYIAPPGVREQTFADVEKQLYEKQAYVKEFLSKCGNEVDDHMETEAVASILYSFLNKRTYEVQKFSGKLMSLTGTFLSAEWEGEDTYDQEGVDM